MSLARNVAGWQRQYGVYVQLTVSARQAKGQRSIDGLTCDFERAPAEQNELCLTRVVLIVLSYLRILDVVVVGESRIPKLPRRGRPKFGPTFGVDLIVKRYELHLYVV